MSATVTFNRRSFDVAMRNVSRETGLGVADILREVMGLWISDIARNTFPKASTHGRAAVKSDIAKLFVKIKAKDIRQARRFDSAYWIMPYENGSVLIPDSMFMHTVSIGEAEQIHAKHRDRRGRVKDSNAVAKHKGLTVINKVPITPAVYNRLVRIKQQHVGTEKAGWAKSADKFGGKIPAWAMKNSHRYPAEPVDNLHGERLEGQLIASNAVPYAKDKGYLRISLRKRMNDLERGYFAKRVKGRIERLNRGA